MLNIFGTINTSVPGQNGFSVVPEAGYFTQRLDSSHVAPIGDNLVIGTDYVISEIGGSNTEITVAPESPDEVRLEPVFVDNLPSPLETGKVYISTKRGFNSALYFSPYYLNQTIAYKLAAYATVVSKNILDLLLRPGKIEFSIFPELETDYSTLCNGKFVERLKYPLYTGRVLANPNLAALLIREGDPADKIRVPDFKDVMPLLITGASDITDIVAGGTFNKSTIARASFRGSVSVNAKKSGVNNRKGYNTAGAPYQFNGGDEDVSLGGSYSPNFNQGVAKDPSKVVFHDWFQASPYCVLYPYIIIR